MVTRQHLTIGIKWGRDKIQTTIGGELVKLALISNIMYNFRPFYRFDPVVGTSNRKRRKYITNINQYIFKSLIIMIKIKFFIQS